MYVIKREDGIYVARAGSVSSYTHNRSEAAEYKTLEQATRSACENESVYRSFYSEQLVHGESNE